MPVLESHVFDIARVIQLAVAPVFLLTAIGTIINALVTRLGRAVDRRRTVEDQLDASEGEAREDMLAELRILARRILLALWSIGLAVLSALFVCLLIGTAFLGAFISLDLSRPVALLFVAAVAALTVCLLLFMREVLLAALHIHHGVKVRPGA